MQNAKLIRSGLVLIAALPGWCLPTSALAEQSRVTVPSAGWELVGDLDVPGTRGKAPIVVMLNQAAGNRHVYRDLAGHLAADGFASLRIDLPGHGDSTNLGRFVPGERHPDPVIWDAEQNVRDIVAFLRDDERFDGGRLAIVGASYSGEEMAEAGRLYGYASAYVALSPGSFSDESIASIDDSGVPWLFVTSRDERYLQDIRAAVSANSESVEQVIVPGTGHATDLLEAHPDLSERIATWLVQHL